MKFCKWANDWMALTIFNCGDSGFGPDPANATQGIDLADCPANPSVFKCRIQHGITQIFQKRANQTIDF